MSYLGSWKIDDLLTFYATTHDPSTGAVADADSAPTYRVYEDETATPILTGSMALLDDANTVGFYSEQITLSEVNVDKGKSYTIRISATVGGVTGTIEKPFQIEAEVSVASLTSAALASIFAFVVEGTFTVKGMLRIMFAVLSGKSTGSGTTTQAYRSVADDKDRASSTVSQGNRTSATRDQDD